MKYTTNCEEIPVRPLSVLLLLLRDVAMERRAFIVKSPTGWR
jgi:hypothetical protein